MCRGLGPIRPNRLSYHHAQLKAALIQTAEQAAVVAELAAVQAQLTEMESRGLAGRFGQGVAPSEARSFEQNRARLGVSLRAYHHFGEGNDCCVCF